MEGDNYSDTFVDYILCKDEQQKEALLQKLFELEQQRWEKNRTKKIPKESFDRSIALSLAKNQEEAR